MSVNQAFLAVTAALTAAVTGVYLTPSASAAPPPGSTVPSAGSSVPPTGPTVPPTGSTTPSTTAGIAPATSAAAPATPMATPATAAAAPAASTAPPTTKPANRLYSYDKTLVPLGASVKVELKSTGDSLWTRLDVSGLAPGHAYGAHVHIAECGADPKAAGPHFQHHPDPAATPTTPSADPAYANPTNEIWLDFTTDAKGAASVNNTHAWSFATNHWPRSLVLHAETTKTGPGVAGTAGARVGCLTLNDGH